MTYRIPILCLAGLLAGCHAADTRPETASTRQEAPPPVPTPPLARVYVSNERSGDVSVIDPATNQVVSTIPVGKRPRGIRVSRDAKTVYVALSGSPIGGPGVKDEDLPPADKTADGIAVVDAATGRFVKKINSGSDPESFSLSPDERTLYVSNEDVGQTSVIDVETGKTLAALKTGYEPEGVTTSPDGRRVYVTSESTNEVFVIDTATRTVTGTIKTAERPRAAAFLPDGSKAYVTCENGGAICVVDVATNTVTKQIKPTGELVRPMGVVVAPDGRRVYVTTGRGQSVVAIDATTDEIVKIIPHVGPRPWGIGVTPDGKTLYTANGPSDDVSVIDAATLTVTSRIKAGQGPWGVAVAGGP